jgi:hypothetical protein
VADATAEQLRAALRCAAAAPAPRPSPPASPAAPPAPAARCLLLPRTPAAPPRATGFAAIPTDMLAATTQRLIRESLSRR